jgi:probable F420-dependent oxidoreductase
VRRPELSIGLPTFAAEDPGGWEPLFELAECADAAGVDRVVMSDHVVFGENLAAYARPELGGVRGGTQPTGPDGHWLEPMTTLAVLAGRTRQVRLGTNILIAALRRPVTLAKSAATLDVLSGGRLDLGVGVGWQREEYDAAGLDFDQRGALLDHTVEVCRELWGSARASFHDSRLDFDAIHMMPKPRQPGGIPIWVSGRPTPRLIRRVARYGHGWIPWDVPRADLATCIATLRQGLREAGREPDGLGVVGSVSGVFGPDGRLDHAGFAVQVGELVASGVTDVRLGTWRPRPSRTEMFDQLQQLVSTFREAASRAPA